MNPPHAPSYYVTSYGVLIGWVTLDGRTHVATDDDIRRDLAGLRACQRGLARERAIIRHRDMVRAVWPERMGRDAMGDPRPLIPAGMREDDSTGFVRLTVDA